jgi:hemoglobin
MLAIPTFICAICAMATLYETLGKETVRSLAHRFYREVEALPVGHALRAMHPADLSDSEMKLADFLEGWMGGPPVYVEKHGHPRLRARHMPFRIDDDARDAWLACMDRALVSCISDAPSRDAAQVAFAALANHMRNAD